MLSSVEVPVPDDISDAGSMTAPAAAVGPPDKECIMYIAAGDEDGGTISLAPAAGIPAAFVAKLSDKMHTEHSDAEQPYMGSYVQLAE